MRNFKVRFVDCLIAIEKDVDVDKAIVIDTVDALVISSKGALYGLGAMKHLTRRKTCLHTHGSIYETVIRLESPRFRFNKSRLAHNDTNLLFYFLYCLMDILLLVAKVGAERKIYFSH